MKKILSLTLALFTIIVVTTSASHKKTTYNFYVDNGTAWDGSVSAMGAYYTTGTFYGTSGQYLIGALNGYNVITVTIYNSAPGTHTYGLTGGVSPTPTPVVTSSGSATFTNIDVVAGDIDAYIH